MVMISSGEIQVREEAPTPRALIDRGVAEICAGSTYTVGELMSRGQSRKLVIVRAQVCRYLRRHGWSYPRIGKYLNRDHSSIMSLIGKYLTDEEIAKRDREAAEGVVAIDGSGAG